MLENYNDETKIKSQSIDGDFFTHGFIAIEAVVRNT